MNTIINGIENANCRMNNTISGYVTIYYVSLPMFTPVPNRFKVGQKFFGSCTASVQPSGRTTYNVTFTKSDSPSSSSATRLIGQYSICKQYNFN